jgi:hypothetical protein
LSDDWLAIILRSHICTESDKVASIDVFLTHASLTLLGAGHPFTLQSPRLSFLSSLATLKRGIRTIPLAARRAGDAEKTELGPCHAIPPIPTAVPNGGVDE